ncbi:hypothetical protein PSN45_003716 [Yamadazyma tenuis]|uniref:uncharacterized protein n=1 Tax=Candida tenuis TaxID=2315449 RepID=UPI00279DA341|nr:hypothetical protein PSN45_003716 [Yamadazyma tenuis]
MLPSQFDPSSLSAVDGNGFDFDTVLSLDSYRSSGRESTAVESVQSHSQDYDEADLKKARELAGMLLDSKRTYLQEHKLLDIRGMEDAFNATDNSKMMTIPKATYLRAERVKATLSLKYIVIDRTYSHQDTIKFPGVDGVYNPLQIIRNRKLRAKYREPPQSITFKTMPLASTAFSSKNIAGKQRPWRLMWAVELNELVGDQAWRMGHIYELKKRNGDLWFPKSSGLSIGSGKVAKARKHEGRLKMKNRLHDKLFVDDDTESGDTKSMVSDQSETSGKSRRSSNLSPLTELKTGRRDRLKTKVRKTLRGSHESGSGSEVEESIQGDESVEIKEEINPYVASKDDLNISSRPFQTELEAPFSSLSNIKFKPTEGKRNETDVVEITEPDLEQPVSLKPQIESLDIQFKKISNNQRFFRNSTIVKLHFLANIYPQLFESACSRIDELTNTTIPRLNQLMVDINDDTIPTYDLQCSTILNEIKSLTLIINDDYSIKIDNLLTSSDRLLAEINTSLSLELRKVDEKLDRLNNSLFGNNFVGKLDLHQNQKISMNESGNYRIKTLSLLYYGLSG